MGKYTSPLYTLLFLITFQSFAQFQIPHEIEVCPTTSSFTLSMDFDTDQSDILTDVSNATFTELSMGDDDFSPLINIGFNFTFYGNTYSSCVISSNNFISFNSTNANTSSVFTTGLGLGTGSPSDIKNAILGPFQDIAPQYGGTIEYATIGTAPNRAFVARWYDVPMYNCTSLTFCSSIIFYESTNVIETHLINKPNCSNWQSGLGIHGLLSSTGDYKEIIYDADEFVNRDHGYQWTTSLEGTRFTPNGTTDYNTSSIDFLPIVSLANATMTDNLGNSYAAQQTTTIQNVSGIQYVVAQANICSSSLSDTTYINTIETDILIDNILTNTTQICPNGTVDLSVEDAADYSSFLWNTGETTSSINVDQTGTYSVNSTKNGCTVSSSVTISAFPNYEINLGNDINLCNGQSITINGFTSNTASYLWNTGATTSSIIVNSAGNYILTGTSNNGCIDSDTLTISMFPVPDVDLGTDIEACENDNINIGQSISGATYLWNTGATTSHIDVTTTGEYILTATIGNCSDSDTIQVNFTSTPVISLPETVEFCEGDSSEINAFYSTNATYLWHDGSTNSTYTAYTAETAWVTVTDNGCLFTDTTVFSTNLYPITNLGPDLTLCESETATLTVQENSATYLWNTTEITQSINVTATGTYTVEVTLNGCTSYDTIQVTFDDTPTTNLGNDIELCDGDSVIFNAFYSATATYLWQDGSTNSMYTSNQTELVWVTITLGNCSFTDSVNVTVFPTPTTDLGANILACEGETVTIGDPVTGATYLWNTGATTATIDVTTTNTYSVTATLGNCSHSDTIEVTFEETPTTNLGNDVELCDGDSVTFNAFYSATANYLWQDGSTNSVYTTDQTELVWVTVTLGSCSFTDSVNVTVFPIPNLNLGADTVACEGETVIIGHEILGGSYLWNTGATTATIPVSSPGIYYVTTALGTCTDSDTIEVTFDETPVINLGNNVEVCHGDSATFDAFYSASATYLWHDGSTNSSYTSYTSENISVTVTLGNCTFTDSVQLTILPVPIVNLGPDVIACEGEILTIGDLTAFSGADFLWNTGATTQTIDITITNTYILTATLGICSYTDTIEVTFDETPVINLGNAVDICEGDSTTFNAYYSPSTTYEWHDGSTGSTYSSDQTELVWVTVTLGNCSFTDSVQVTEYPSPITALGPDIIACEGDVVTLSVQENGAVYAWNTTEITQSIQPNATGIYTVEVTKNGCISYDTVDVTFNDVPQINLGSNINLCTGDSITFNAYYSATATYLWQDGSTNSTYTSYITEQVSVTVTLLNCTYSDQVSVTINEYPDANLGNDIEVCENVPVTLLVPENGATYLWNTAQITQSIQPQTTGFYNVEVTKNGCTSYDTIYVLLKDVPEINLGNDTTICEGESIVYDAFYSQYATYLWQDGSVNSTFTATQSGTVSVTVSLDGCTTFESVVVTVNPIPEINLDDSYEFCMGDSLTLSAFYSNTATYLWSTGETNVQETFTTNGNYNVVVTDKGCTYIEEFQIIVHLRPILDVEDQAICVNEIATFNAFSPNFIQYEWSTGESTSSIELNTEGWYWVDVYNTNCMLRDSFYLTVNQSPTFNLPEDTTVCDDEPLILDVTSEDATYLWNTGSTDSVLEVVDPGIYWVNVLNGCGERIDTVKIHLEDCSCHIYAPTAINYNSTSESGAFEIKADCEFVQYKLKIFNRWGQLVFTSQSPDVYWIPHQSETETQDVYIYMLEYGFDKGKIRSKTGNVILLH